VPACTQTATDLPAAASPVTGTTAPRATQLPARINKIVEPFPM
jgi:hypothetical protein